MRKPGSVLGTSAFYSTSGGHLLEGLVMSIIKVEMHKKKTFVSFVLGDAMLDHSQILF